MTRSQKLLIELDEKKQRLARILDKPDEGTAAELKEVSDRIEALPQLIAAARQLEEQTAGETAAGNPLDSEGAELQALYQRPIVGEIFSAVARGQQPEGAAREAQQAAGARDTDIPWPALLPDNYRAADSAAVAPTTGLPVTQHPIIGRLFNRTAAAYLGVVFPSVPVGQTSYVVLDTGATAAPQAIGDAVNAEVVTWGVKTLSPKRLTARYLFRLEDAMTVQGLEQAYRADLAGTLGEQLDKQVLAGDGVAPNISGFFDADAGELTVPANVTDEATVKNYIDAITGVVDGKNAVSESEVRLLIGSPTLTHAGGKFITNTSDTALEKVRNLAGGVRVSGHVPAMDASSKNQLALTAAAGMAGYAVAPMWAAGPSVIRDEISGAAKGEVALTILSFFNFAIARKDGFTLHKFKIAA